MLRSARGLQESARELPEGAPGGWGIIAHWVFLFQKKTAAIWSQIAGKCLDGTPTRHVTKKGGHTILTILGEPSDLAPQEGQGANLAHLV